jgi:chorismate dehydratase
MNQRIHWQHKPRLGLINYINCLPVLLPITNGLVDLDAQVILGQPSRLNSLFAAGELEYGAMSAFAFLEQSKYLKLIPGLSISSQRAVASVLLFSKESIAKYPPLRICVPAGSATSINAMLLMLLQFGKCEPALVTAEEPDLNESNFDAALVIGDRALLVDEDWSNEYYRYDLGEWWRETFNLPMVFGVFAVRNDYLLANDGQPGMPSVIDKLAAGLVKAADLGLNDYFAAVLNEAALRTGLSRPRLERYYKRELDFSWSAKHQQAIDKYELLCRQNGMFEDKKVLA